MVNLSDSSTRVLAENMVLHNQAKPTHQYNRRMRWFVYVSVVYFFFNSTLLPHGLLYTTIVAPLFYIWLIKKRERWVISRYMLFTVPIAFTQLLINKDIQQVDFFRSYVLYLLIFVSVFAFSTVCKRISAMEMAKLFSLLIRLNLLFSLFAILMLWSPLADYFWIAGRLNLLNYEPSHYATLMIPLVTYAIYRFIFRVGRYYSRELLYIAVPFFLTVSVGVIGGLGLSFCIMFLITFRKMIVRPSVIIFLLAAISLGAIVIGVENPLGARMINFLQGNDSSGTVRTIQSNYVAWKIAESSSFIVGSGFGQAKLLAADFFDEFWLGLDYKRIANAVAGTFAEFGFIGIGIRLFLEIFLFIKTKVSQSYYRMTLFLFMFIYQFTGSYTTNLAEYVIWTLAFVPVFYEFESKYSGKFNSKRVSSVRCQYQPNCGS